MALKDLFSPRRLFKNSATAHHRILELMFSISGLDKNSVADTIQAHLLLWADKSKTDCTPPVSSGLACVTGVVLSPIFGTASSSTPTSATTATTNDPALVFPELDNIDCGEVAVPHHVATSSSTSPLSFYPEDLDVIDESDSDDSASVPSLPPSTTTGHTDPKASQPDPAAFAYAGFGPSIFDQIDYDVLPEPSVGAVRSVLHTSVDDDASFQVSPHVPDPFESAPRLAAIAGCTALVSELELNDNGVVDACGATSIPEPSLSGVPVYLFDGTDSYVVCGTLGAGAFGRVMLATNNYGEDVAIKVVHKDKQYQSGDGRQMILNECAALARVSLSGKAFLTPLLASWQDEQNVYMVMRLYYDSLDRVLSGYKVHSDPETLKLYTTELVLALKNLHDLNIMHRDIKPSNILIGADGHLALGDFGLAFLAPKPKWKLKNCTSWDIVGTAEYMAPEMLSYACKVNGYRSTADVWSLGVVLYEIACGFAVPYFSAASEQERRERIMWEVMDFSRVDEVNVFLGDLIRKMLIRDPKQRMTVDGMLTHPYFRDIDWDLFQRSPPPAYILPTSVRWNTATDISFESYHMGLDPDFNYANCWEDDKLVLRSVVHEQLCLDRTNPICHDFRCPKENWRFAMHGFVDAHDPRWHA